MWFIEWCPLLYLCRFEYGTSVIQTCTTTKYQGTYKVNNRKYMCIPGWKYGWWMRTKACSKIQLKYIIKKTIYVILTFYKYLKYYH